MTGTAKRALIALQGPRSVEILSPLVDRDVASLRYYSAAEVTACERPALVARTGYTGEDGFELFISASDAVHVWRRLLEAGRPAGLEPAGLGARDVLRLEAGMPLYGHELEEDVSPLQAGLGWAIKFEKPAFTGRGALERRKRAADDYRADRRAGARRARSGARRLSRSSTTAKRSAKSAADRSVLP